MSVFVVRVFVRIREFVIVHRDLADKLRELERKVGEHDEHIQAIIQAIRQLMTPSPCVLFGVIMLAAPAKMIEEMGSPSPKSA